ncbi:alpha/beta hydrolase [Longimycelium tulufanense]|uniref:Alpha/beta hydrolase n=1 Tax=Longimycelium tulufanense TaxID=907463 RepID=A0A8J3FVH8_9PSEU|nr:alpha/beta hydrolase [Longimycelium tulufanense]GGM44594.1 alpha/beta hydrolase [Longimycelium tulufanense]
MRVEFGGEGQGILLLHGLMGRATTWWPVTRWLTAYGRVVGLDARGHGRNPAPAGSCRTEDFAADAAKAVEELDLAPAVVIGHSMGGLHGLALAASRPELVRALVVEDMAVDQRGRTVADWQPWFRSWPVPFRSLAHVRSFFGEQNPVVGNYFVECVEERTDGYHFLCDLDEAAGIAAEWGERPFWSFVDDLRCPLLLIEGQNGIVPSGQMAEMARRAPDARHIVVPGAGHLVHDEEPDIYRGAVSAFLSEVLAR